MNNSLISSLVGMQSSQKQIDTIANNISNLETTGYKNKNIYFSDIMSEKLNQPDEFKLDGRKTELGLNQAFGMKNTAILTDFKQGSSKNTGIDTDFMLQGEDIFFTILTPEGDAGELSDLRYTRDGHFQLDAYRFLVTDRGDYVLNTEEEPIQIPSEASFSVNNQGQIIATYNDGESENLGSLYITRLFNPQILEGVGNNQYKISNELLNTQDLELVDTEFSLDNQDYENYLVLQGSLESSNSNLTQEMVKLNEAQRLYQLLSDGLSISNQMLSLASKLRG